MPERVEPPCIPRVGELGKVTMAATTREVQVDADTRRKPKVVARLQEWEYLEKTFHRLLCAWGRHFAEWPDKVELFRHLWDQAECVRRIRERLQQFPGTATNCDAPVSALLESFGDTVLHAPSFEDAIDGIYQLYLNALATSYVRYAEIAHPVHDAPTLAMIAENVRVKEQFRLWLRGYRRRKPHHTDTAYRKRAEAALAACGHLVEPLEVGEDAAQPIGLRLEFSLPARAAHPSGTEPKADLMPYLEADFSESIEARRLFWCYGYMLEMNLAEDQLLWLWSAHDMPWEFLQDVTRHTWDESRHGDSGHSRLLDFGIRLQEIGYPYYQSSLDEQGDWSKAQGKAALMSTKELYEQVFFIGMVAETGHFHVKHEAYEDFKSGGDLESAEMVLFDIIDETSHVQYAHRWLPQLAKRAGIEEDFKARGAAERERLLKESEARARQNRDLPKSGPAYDLYQSLIRRMREQVPLSNAETCPPRSFKPM